MAAFIYGCVFMCICVLCFKVGVCFVLRFLLEFFLLIYANLQSCCFNVMALCFSRVVCSGCCVSCMPFFPFTTYFVWDYAMVAIIHMFQSWKSI